MICPISTVSQSPTTHIYTRNTYDAVELGPLVALRPPQVVLSLARAELPEVLGCLRDDVGEELKLDPAEGFS